MKKLFLLTGIISMLFLICINGENAEKIKLEDVNFSNDVLTIKTSAPVKYGEMKLEKPPRIYFDLYDTVMEEKQKKIHVDSPFVKTVRVSQFQLEPQPITRVVLDLTEIVDFKSTKEKNIIKVSLEQSQEQILNSIIEGEEKREVKPKKTEAVKKTVVKKSNTEKNETTSKSGGYKIIFPKTKVTFEYQEADIQDVLQVMAIRSGVNIIAGSDVTGTITISLKDVPFDEAFNTVLNLKGLVYVPVAENVIRVITPAQLTTEKSQAVTFTKVFTLNYADADEVKQHLDAIRNIEQRKGIINVDKRTNSLIITDTALGLDASEKLIKELDVKPMQVMIEAKVVDLDITNAQEIGIQWEGRQTETTPGGGIDITGGQKIVGPVTVTEPGAAGLSRAEGRGVKFISPVGAEGTIFSFGFINDTNLFNAQLSALIKNQKANVLSNPRVTTLNNKEAKIISSKKQPYMTVTYDPVSQTSRQEWVFLDVGVTLTVLPTISANRWITMKIKPIVSIVTEAPSASGAPPQVGTREAEVTVMVRENETIVIGGLIREEDSKLIEKVPLLGDIPILGAFFKYKKESKNKNELIIFITPKIIEN